MPYHSNSTSSPGIPPKGKPVKFLGKFIETQFLALLGVGLVIYIAAYWHGRLSVTNADRLAAANEVMFRIVETTRIPSKEVFDQALTSCEDERAVDKDLCVESYVRLFADFYQVNLVTGQHSKINDDSPARLSKETGEASPGEP